MRETLEQCADILRDTRHVCVLTGAGVSAESGVPTFRDAQDGLWADYDPHELATPEGFLNDPALVWRWYRWRRELVSQVKPNAGHLALAELQSLVPRLTLITQNVDGLHTQAGSDDVIEFHGNIHRDLCFTTRQPVKIEDADVPVCPCCGGHVRPGVVWFGEAIPEDALNAAFAAVSDCDVFISIGTSSLVYPAAGLVETARDTKSKTIEINPNATPHSTLFDFVLGEKSGVILPELLNSLAT